MAGDWQIVNVQDNPQQFPLLAPLRGLVPTHTDDLVGTAVFAGPATTLCHRPVGRA